MKPAKLSYILVTILHLIFIIKFPSEFVLILISLGTYFILGIINFLNFDSLKNIQIFNSLCFNLALATISFLIIYTGWLWNTRKFELGPEYEGWHFFPIFAAIGVLIAIIAFWIIAPIIAKTIKSLSKK